MIKSCYILGERLKIRSDSILFEGCKCRKKCYSTKP